MQTVVVVSTGHLVKVGSFPLVFQSFTLTEWRVPQSFRWRPACTQNGLNIWRKAIPVALDIRKVPKNRTLSVHLAAPFPHQCNSHCRPPWHAEIAKAHLHQPACRGRLRVCTSDSQPLGNPLIVLLRTSAPSPPRLAMSINLVDPTYKDLKRGTLQQRKNSECQKRNATLRTHCPCSFKWCTQKHDWHICTNDARTWPRFPTVSLEVESLSGGWEWWCECHLELVTWWPFLVT